MTKGGDSHSEMAHVRQSDGINVIFDQNSPASSRSRSPSRSRSRSSHGRRRDSHRGRYRSSSSSSSRSSSHTRSRSRPRCHRPSSRCRCDNHRRYGRGRRTPPRCFRAHSRSYSRSPTPDRRSHNRRNRSRSRRAVSRCFQSPPRSHRSQSKSRSSEQSVNLSLADKRELLKAAKANAIRILGVEQLELPKSVKPILTEQSGESEESEQVSSAWVRLDPERTPSQSSDVDPDDESSPKMSPNRKIISFSINNSVVKPTAASSSSSVKVTSRMDSYESRKPYGHWVPVRSGRTTNARKHTLATSH